jgi:hypothetical protein
MEPLPPVEMEQHKVAAMRSWASTWGKSVRQRNVRQETCAYKPGTMPLNVYWKAHVNAPVVNLNDEDVPVEEVEDNEVAGAEMEITVEAIEHNVHDDTGAKAENSIIRHGSEESVDQVEDDYDSDSSVDSQCDETELHFLATQTRSGRVIKVNMKYR